MAEGRKAEAAGPFLVEIEVILLSHPVNSKTYAASAPRAFRPVHLRLSPALKTPLPFIATSPPDPARHLKRVVLGCDLLDEVSADDGHLLQDVLAHARHAVEEEEREDARDGAEAAQHRGVVGAVGPVQALEGAIPGAVRALEVLVVLARVPRVEARGGFALGAVVDLYTQRRRQGPDCQSCVRHVLSSFLSRLFGFRSPPLPPLLSPPSL
nr:hypothetical protein CFP56_28617 [Quercus suber]